MFGHLEQLLSVRCSSVPGTPSEERSHISYMEYMEIGVSSPGETTFARVIRDAKDCMFLSTSGREQITNRFDTSGFN